MQTATAVVVTEGEELPAGYIEPGAVKPPEGKIPVTLKNGGDIVGWAENLRRDGNNVLMDITLIPMHLAVPNGEADENEVPFRTQEVDPPWSVDDFECYPYFAPYEGYRRRKGGYRITSGTMRGLMVGLKGVGANPAAHMDLPKVSVSD